MFKWPFSYAVLYEHLYTDACVLNVLPCFVTRLYHGMSLPCLNLIGRLTRKGARDFPDCTALYEKKQLEPVHFRKG